MTANQIAFQSAMIQHMHNKADENIRTQANAETHRANLARETETHRSNVINEIETERSHRVNETETNRANIARETETHRTNVANENLRGMELEETSRHNRATEENTRKATSASVLAAQIGSQGRVQAANIGAGASMYATDIHSRDTQYQQSINALEAATHAATQRADQEYKEQSIALRRAEQTYQALMTESQIKANENKAFTNMVNSSSNLISQIVGAASVLAGGR